MAIASKDLLVALKSYARANALPLDASELYNSKAEAEAYLKQANAYAGQTIKVLENGKYITYTVQPNEDGLGLTLEESTSISFEEDTVKEGVKQHSTADWLDKKDNVYPAGTVLVYTDRTTVDGVPVADIKIANGISTVGELPFLSDSDVEKYLKNNGVSVEDGVIVATTFRGALEHSLTIGPYVYNGSQDVEVPVYDGE